MLSPGTFKDIYENSTQTDYQMMLNNFSKDDLVKRYEEILMENISLQTKNEELVEKNYALKLENEQLKQSLMVKGNI